jgi:hypothetical protein
MNPDKCPNCNTRNTHRVEVDHYGTKVVVTRECEDCPTLYRHEWLNDDAPEKCPCGGEVSGVVYSTRTDFALEVTLSCEDCILTHYVEYEWPRPVEVCRL